MKRLPLLASTLAAPMLLALQPFSASAATSGGTYALSSATIDGSCQLTVTWSWSGYSGGNDLATISVSEDGSPAISQAYKHVSGKSGTETLTSQLQPSSVGHSFSPTGALEGGGGKLFAYLALGSQGSPSAFCQ